MPQISCPYCQTHQVVSRPDPGSSGRHTCGSCQKEFAVRGTPAPAAQTRSHSTPVEQKSKPSPVSLPVEIPKKLGPYEIRGIIGAGGMGVVFKGWDAQLNRNVAVKTLRPELAQDPEYHERFLREARAAAALSHPNVTQIHFIGEEKGQPFFAMEFLEGQSLDQVLEAEGKLAPEKALDLVRQSAKGLHAAAGRGIIHRDIKPSNLVLTSDGIVKVTDFGLAKLVVSDAGLTMAGVILGSPNYLAPEQASGGTTDVRSDIYSLGATLYELVTGRPPFEGPTPVSIILKHAREPLRSPRQFTPELPYPLVTLVQRMMAKRREDRPQTYEALLKEIDGISFNSVRGSETVRVAVSTRPPSGANPVPKPEPRSVSGLLVIVAILILGSVAGWGFLKRAGAGTRSSSAGSQTPGLGNSQGVQSSRSDLAPPNLEGNRTRRRSIDFSPTMGRSQTVARANLIFVENTHEVTQEGRLRVVGSVVNTGGGQAASVKVQIVLTDSAGQIIDKSVVALTPSLLGPHQSGTFEAFFSKPAQPVNIRTELNWNS